MKTQRIFPLDTNGNFRTPVIGCFIAIGQNDALEGVCKSTSRPMWCKDEGMYAHGMIVGVSEEPGYVFGGQFMTNSQAMKEGKISAWRNQRLIIAIMSDGSVAKILAQPGSSSLRFYSVKT